MSDDILPYAPVIIKLLQGILYHDDTEWGMLLDYLAPLQTHFAQIGLTLHFDESEGYAFLEQPEPDEEEVQPLPRLVRRTRLAYYDTLLCVLLRERLLQFDAQEPDVTRLVLSREAIHEMMRIFLGEQSDEVRLANRVDTVIRRVEGLGFLKRLKRGDEEQYEVRRILKAKITADRLVEIMGRLEAHAEANRV